MVLSASETYVDRVAIIARLGRLVAEALGVAVAMNAGAALVYSTRALEAFDSATGA